MGLIKKIFGGGNGGGSGGSGTSRPADLPPLPHDDFHDSTDIAKVKKMRLGPRRDLVRLTLGETMRKHGIPSDWIESRTLSVFTRQHKAAMHVQFLVRKADQQLLNYVHAFQESFWDDILRADPLAKDWLLSVGWEFYGKAVQNFSPIASAGSWQDTTEEPARPAEDEPDTQPTEATDDELASDLAALQELMTAQAPAKQPR